MKKLLLIPTLATSVVAPIIATTSCSRYGNWITWDFAQNEQYDYKMDIPDQTVSPGKAFGQYLDMIEQNPDNFGHEFMLSFSKMIESSKNPPDPGEKVDVDIATWTEEIKVNAFDRRKKRISFDVKVNEDSTRTVTDTIRGIKMINKEKIVMDLSCENIPLSYYNAAGDWMITSGAHHVSDDRTRLVLISNKDWSISGSMYIKFENIIENNVLPKEFSDSNFLYNFHTALSDEIWNAEDQNIKSCCLYAFKYVDHISYYMSNIPAPL